MPDRDLSLLAEVAREAGDIAMRYWRNAPRAWEKDEGAGPVTEADLAVNDHLHARLLAARPDYGWLSEESTEDASRLDARRCFIIDPIDGTRAFIDGQQGFSHSLAVAEGDRIIAAVVHLPAMNLTYRASSASVSTLNNQPITPSATADLAQATVLTPRSMLDAAYWKGGQPPEFRREFRPSLAWRLCLVAEGRFDVALSLRDAWEWDIAAGSLIAAQAGAIVSDMHGGRMRFNSPRARVQGLVIANSDLHGQILNRLAPQPSF